MNDEMAYKKRGGGKEINTWHLMYMVESISRSPLTYRKGYSVKDIKGPLNVLKGHSINNAALRR